MYFLLLLASYSGWSRTPFSLRFRVCCMFYDEDDLLPPSINVGLPSPYNYSTSSPRRPPSTVRCATELPVIREFTALISRVNFFLKENSVMNFPIEFLENIQQFKANFEQFSKVLKSEISNKFRSTVLMGVSSNLSVCSGVVLDNYERLTSDFANIVQNGLNYHQELCFDEFRKLENCVMKLNKMVPITFFHDPQAKMSRSTKQKIQELKNRCFHFFTNASARNKCGCERLCKDVHKLERQFSRTIDDLPKNVGTATEKSLLKYAFIESNGKIINSLSSAHSFPKLLEDIQICCNKFSDSYNAANRCVGLVHRAVEAKILLSTLRSSPLL